MDAAYTTYIGTTYAVATEPDEHGASPPPYRVGRLRTTSSQMKSCRGTEGFAMAAEHRETKHDGVIINHSGLVLSLPLADGRLVVVSNAVPPCET